MDGCHQRDLEHASQANADPTSRKFLAVCSQVTQSLSPYVILRLIGKMETLYVARKLVSSAFGFGAVQSGDHAQVEGEAVAVPGGRVLNPRPSNFMVQPAILT